MSSASAGGDARAILCAGIIVLDEVFRVDRFPQPDAKTQAQSFFIVNGGCAANAAVAVARLGGRVSYFASQPWPFPTSLMIGCHAEALSREIVIERAELDDARWFDREEVASMLLRCHPDGLTTPPTMAIAYHIIRAWVEEEVEFR